MSSSGRLYRLGKWCDRKFDSFEKIINSGLTGATRSRYNTTLRIRGEPPKRNSIFDPTGCVPPPLPDEPSKEFLSEPCPKNKTHSILKSLWPLPNLPRPTKNVETRVPRRNRKSNRPIT